MRIPKSFKLMGHTIMVKYDPNKAYEEDRWGHASYRSDEIVLQPITKGADFPEAIKEHVFLHELVHHLAYYTTGTIHDIKVPLHKNEEFVDLFSALLHQALTTMEYEDDGSNPSK